MLLPASVDANVVTCHSAEHPCGASALRGLIFFRYAASHHKPDNGTGSLFD